MLADPRYLSMAGAHAQAIENHSQWVELASPRSFRRLSWRVEYDALRVEDLGLGSMAEIVGGIGCSDPGC